ncbi:hypothetical protein [Sinomonas susongensis]|uniref:hypothetical protein n=1 Tax=Sinomonas susongensis TaxID=1324851 RepID=UPI001109DBD4|nr:hypothetical protein [Sinomonas susongensis]
MARFHYRSPKSSRHFQQPRQQARPRPVPPPQQPVPQQQAVPPLQPTPSRRNPLDAPSPEATERWRELLAPDGTPPALPYQIDYVRSAVRQETGVRPSLRGLTVGQAERILAAINVDPRPLWRSGRDSWVMNVLAIFGKWLAVALLFIVILSLGRADGMPVVVLILMGFGLSAVRRQRRQAFENRRYRHARLERPAVPEAYDGGTGGPVAGSPEPGGGAEDPGSPYDVETYLKRLGRDGR